MTPLLVPLQVLAGLGTLDLLTTLAVVLVALIVARVLLKVAIKVALVAAVVVGLLWLFGALPVVSF